MVRKLFAFLAGLFVLLPFAFGQIGAAKSWEYHDHYVFSGADLNTSPKVFNNLQGDTWDYRFYVYKESITTNNQIRFRLNGDSGSNYRSCYMEGGGSSASAGASDTVDYCISAWTGTNNSYASFAVHTITGDSSTERAIDGFYGGAITTTTYVDKVVAFWKNTSDELTSLEIYATTTDSVSGEIYVFKRRKAGTYNAADWELIENYEFSGVNLSTSPKTFSNLTGDTDIEYKLEALVENDSATTSNINVRLNGDSGANYSYQLLYNNAGSLTALGGTGATSLGFTTNQAGSGAPNAATMIIQAKSGAVRPVLRSGAGSTANQQISDYRTWTNTSDEVTSIVCTGSASVNSTGSIKLYKRSKKRSVPSHERLIFDHDISGDFSSGTTLQNLKEDAIYRISISAVDGGTDAGYTQVLFNGDSGANYPRQVLTATASTTSATSSTASDIQGPLAYDSVTGIGEIWLFPKTGKYRPVISDLGYSFSSALYKRLSASWWANTSDALSSITFQQSSSNSITGNIKVWEIALPENPKSSEVAYSVAGLVLWLDASAITGLSDGDGVSPWADKSYYGNDASQGTGGFQPTYETNELNGFPVVRFDGSDDRLDIANDSSMQISTSMTCFYVGSYDDWSTAVNQTVLTKGPWSNGLNYAFGKRRDPADLKFTYNDGSFQSVFETTTEISEGTRYIFTTVVNKSDNKVYFYRNGTLLSSPTDGNSLNYSATSTTGAKIGANGSNGELFNGDIAEILLYTGALSDSDREKIEQYLGEKYNITY